MLKAHVIGNVEVITDFDSKIIIKEDFRYTVKRVSYINELHLENEHPDYFL
jgi:hypothetical protein